MAMIAMTTKSSMSVKAGRGDSFGCCRMIHDPVHVTIVRLVQAKNANALHGLDGALIFPTMAFDVTIGEYEIRTLAVTTCRDFVPSPASNINAAKKKDAVVNAVLVFLEQYERLRRAWLNKIFW